MVTDVSLRYQYWIIPWLSSRSAARPGGPSGNGSFRRARGDADARGVAAILAAPISCPSALSWPPWRISIDSTADPQPTRRGPSVSSAGSSRPGDAIAANEPHPHAAYIEAGHVSRYDLHGPPAQGLRHAPEGTADRSQWRRSSDRVARRLDEGLQKHDRCGRRHREGSARGARIYRWEYPPPHRAVSAKEPQIEGFRGYLWTVYLWKPRADNSRDSASIDAHQGRAGPRPAHSPLDMTTSLDGISGATHFRSRCGPRQRGRGDPARTDGPDRVPARGNQGCDWRVHRQCWQRPRGLRLTSQGFFHLASLQTDLGFS